MKQWNKRNKFDKNTLSKHQQRTEQKETFRNIISYHMNIIKYYMKYHIGHIAHINFKFPQNHQNTPQKSKNIAQNHWTITQNNKILRKNHQNNAQKSPKNMAQNHRKLQKCTYTWKKTDIPRNIIFNLPLICLYIYSLRESTVSSLQKHTLINMARAKRGPLL